MADPEECPTRATKTEIANVTTGERIRPQGNISGRISQHTDAKCQSKPITKGYRKREE